MRALGGKMIEKKEYVLATGLVATHPKKFKNEEEAWNTLSKLLNEEYAIPKGGKNNGVTAVLYRIEIVKVPIVKHRFCKKYYPKDTKEFTSKIPIALGMVRYKWGN